jgi:hypothetical protein
MDSTVVVDIEGVQIVRRATMMVVVCWYRGHAWNVELDEVGSGGAITYTCLTCDRCVQRLI